MSFDILGTSCDQLIRKVYACLAVTCHLHFWQNDRDFLRATVVTRGWNGYRDTESRPWRRKFSRRSSRDSKEFGALTTELSPPPLWRWGEREIIYLSLHCHHYQNDFCIKMGSDESHFNVSVGSDGQSHRTVSTNHNLFEENGESKRYRTEVLPLTSLTPYR